jgi:hypothetical protein
MRERLPVTRDSMREWLARPEWAYLIALLHETCDEALAALLAADPANTVAIARAQTEVKTLRFFTDGELANAMLNELKPTTER